MLENERTRRRETRTPLSQKLLLLHMCKSRSAPGPDDVPYSVLKKVPRCFLSRIAELYTACMKCGYFPREWKSAIGVMLLKPKKDAKVATNYRPISLLNRIGKLFEKVIAQRKIG